MGEQRLEPSLTKFATFAKNNKTLVILLGLISLIPIVSLVTRRPSLEKSGLLTEAQESQFQSLVGSDYILFCQAFSKGYKSMIGMTPGGLGQDVFWSDKAIIIRGKDEFWAAVAKSTNGINYYYRSHLSAAAVPTAVLEWLEKTGRGGALAWNVTAANSAGFRPYTLSEWLTPETDGALRAAIGEYGYFILLDRLFQGSLDKKVKVDKQGTRTSISTPLALLLIDESLQLWLAENLGSLDLYAVDLSSIDGSLRNSPALVSKEGGYKTSEKPMAFDVAKARQKFEIGSEER